ncbi:MAG: DUF1566 domain-containing protein [Planctomycetes bacterium]|nr:DUF1566 domain-containing protein [Planctomycetota bacterium]
MRRHLMQSLIISFIFIYPQITPVAMAARGLEPVLIKDKQGKQVGLYNESYALVIGASRYTNGWPKLPGVRKDVKLVTGILEGHGFKVIPVNDPDKEQLSDAFEDFINQYGRKEENRLLFYFAGHGHTLKQSYGDEMGYIIPVDAPDPEKDLDSFMEKSMDMQQLEVFAKRIQSKHAIFLFDSCFSGSLFALSRAIPKSITYKTSKPVRQFITSGSAEETVPDKSTFREQFVAALEGEGDVNEDGYVTGTELGQFLQDTVINYTHESRHPQYGKIRNRNLDKGDFVFALKSVAYEQSVQLPSKPGDVETFTFGNIDKRKKQRQEDENRLNAAKAEWSNWQKKLDSAYNKALEYDKEKYISTSEKAQMWKRLADSFSQDNPYSLTDQLIRSKAKERLNYWKNYKAPKPAVKKPPVVIRKEPTFGGAASINLRSSSRTLSVSQVQSMPNVSIREKKGWGFYGHSTVSHSYKKRSISGDSVVVDQTTGLMWHQSGSDKSMLWIDAKGWVRSLNNRGYAGYHDWRLPTVEEAASLLESKKSDGLYIDPVFSKKQSWIWTSDGYGSSEAWRVLFIYGDVEVVHTGSNGGFVRPVRSGK